MVMTVMVERLTRVVWIQAEMVQGIMVSIMSTSFEKRFVMRPMGVTSKKKRGERRMLVSMSTCRFFEARTRPVAKITLANRTDTPAQKPVTSRVKKHE